VSEPTFRIDVEHRPAEETFGAWVATVRRISDGEMIGVRRGDEADHAVSRARELIYESTKAQEPFTLYTNDLGEITDTIPNGHSVRA
jgi:hypothetical protein